MEDFYKLQGIAKEFKIYNEKNERFKCNCETKYLPLFVGFLPTLFAIF